MSIREVKCLTDDLQGSPGRATSYFETFSSIPIQAVVLLGRISNKRKVSNEKFNFNVCVHFTHCFTFRSHSSCQGRCLQFCELYSEIYVQSVLQLLFTW